jgi:hypothetical protein
MKFEILKTKMEDTELGDKIKRDMDSRVKATNLLHIGHLVGINLTLKDAEKVADGKRLQTEDARGTILTNYRNVLEFTRSSVADSYSEIDINVLLHLNKIMLTDWKETWEARFRSGGESPDPIYDNWLDLRDKDIEPVRIQEELGMLIEWYKSNLSKVHPLIRIGIFVYKLMRIAPFTVLNKLTIIAVTDYLMHKSKYSQLTFIPSSRNFDIYEDEYIEAWTNSIQGKYNPESNKLEQKDNITLWIERFTRNLSNEILENRTYATRKVSEQKETVKQPFLDLNKRQLKILRYLQTIPTVKREDFVQMMNVSTMTAYRDLNDLAKKKLIKIEGNGRGTKYMLANR